MTHILRRIIFAALLTAGLAPAAAQQFPTVSSGSVLGRTQSGPGPSQAIPFQNLATSLSSYFVIDVGGMPINGLVADAVQATTSVSITSGQKALVTGANIGSSCRAGSTVVIPGAGASTTTGGNTDYAPLVAKVTSVSGTTYTLDTSALSSVSTTKTVTCGTDNTTAVQSAITSNASSYFKFGSYLIASDITVPSNRRVWIPQGATVLSAGRFTTAAVSASNVRYQIDGQLTSLGLQAAATQSGLGWPSTERGFIEFGGSPASPASNFSLTGTGKVFGDFTGSSNFNNPTYQLNRKGIATWFASHVLIEDVEVSGFHGETVYALPGTGSVQDIKFSRLFVHDVRFSGLNFNAPTTSPPVTFGGNEGMIMSDNYVYNSYLAIETGVGTIANNRVNGYVYTGIQWGLGSGQGPLIVTHNTVVGGGTAAGASLNICGSSSRSSVGMCLAFGASPPWNPGTNFIIDGNVVYNPGDSCYVLANVSYGQFANNQCNGAGQATSAVSFDFTNVHYVLGSGNSDVNAGAHWTASMGSVTSDNLVLSPMIAASKGSLIAMGNDNISTYIAPSGTAGQALINNVGAAPSYGALNLGGGTNVVSGILPLIRGGTGADLSATGGASQVLKQTSVGGVVTVARLACADLSNAATSCSTDATNASNISSGTLAAARGGAGTITGALRANGAGAVSQAASTDLSDVTNAGSWVPADGSGASLTFTSVTANFSKLNKTCVGNFRLTFPTTASGAFANITLPCTTANNGAQALGSCFSTAASPNGNFVITGTANSAVSTFVNSNAAAVITNATLSTTTVSCNFAFITN